MLMTLFERIYSRQKSYQPTADLSGCKGFDECSVPSRIIEKHAKSGSFIEVDSQAMIIAWVFYLRGKSERSDL
jgi:hypothetical protein